MSTSQNLPDNPNLEAQKFIENYGLDLTDLSPENVKKADDLLQKVYTEWRSGNIDDLVANEIGNIFEAEPIHNLMKVSVYPLCDIYIHLQNGTIEEIKLL